MYWYQYRAEYRLSYLMAVCQQSPCLNSAGQLRSQEPRYVCDRWVCVVQTQTYNAYLTMMFTVLQLS